MVKSVRGMSLVELIVAIGILGVVSAGIMTLISSLQKETKYVSQKLAALDFEKQLILLTSTQDVCAKVFTDAPATYTYAQTAFPPSAPVLMDRVYTNATATTPLIQNNQPIDPRDTSFVVEQIALEGIVGTAGNYTAKLSFRLGGSLRQMMPISIRVSLKTQVTAPNISLTGCQIASPVAPMNMGNFFSRFGSGLRCPGDRWVIACRYNPDLGWQYNYCDSRGHAGAYNWQLVWDAGAGGYRTQCIATVPGTYSHTRPGEGCPVWNAGTDGQPIKQDVYCEEQPVL
jgi:prepilin-type N-terminal cleavage/methylation domain-containing protein